MDDTVAETINTLERPKAAIEWDFSLEYFVAIEDAIEILKQHLTNKEDKK